MTDDRKPLACPVEAGPRSDEVCINGRLITEIAGGDRASFTEFYRMTSHRVYGLALRMLGNRATAEEIAQDVYLQVWSMAGRYDENLASPIGWLMMLTHRRAVDRVRREQAGENRDIAYGRKHMEPGRDVVSEAVELRADRRAVLGCLETLTDRQRTTITLAYYGGLTYSDVADHLEVPVGTVKSRIRDGLERLRTCLSGSDRR
ncbi:sigma-70 family RNA polymerase sigma factor SigK [Nocardia heshunensis]